MTSLRTILAVCVLAPVVAVAQPGQLVQRTPEREAVRAELEQRVTLDLQVTDASGNPIRGLSQSSFRVQDSGQPTPLTSFKEIDEPGARRPVQAIIVIDAMNAPFQTVVLERQGVDQFLRQNGGHLPLPVSIVFLTDAGVKISKPSLDGLELANNLARIPSPMRMLDSAQGVSGAMDREQRSLSALQMLTRYEASQPGRKLLVWMGPGWPLLAGLRTFDPSTENARRYYTYIVDTTTALRRAHVTLYSVEPLNLSAGTGQSAFLYQDFLKGVTKPSQADSPNLGVQVLALHSGGLVLNKDGNLPAQIDRCLADAQTYYEVTFKAAPGDHFGVYHPIKVTVDQPGVRVRTSTAYYAGRNQLTQDPANSAAGTQTPISTVQAQARLVVLDVAVLDSKGHPISGLKSGDFRVRDDGHLQSALRVKEHVDAAGAESSATRAASLPPISPVLTNKPAAGSVWNVLAVDLLNIPAGDRGRLQQQLQAFVKALQPGTPVALIAMANGIKVLSSFPDGKAGLERALSKGLGSYEIGVPADIQERNRPIETMNKDAAALQLQANMDVERQAERAQATLDDFAAIGQWLGSYQGKKNVFWLSSGFALEGQPYGVLGHDQLHPVGPGLQGVEKLPMQSRTDAGLERARVAIYPVDVRGVAVGDVIGETTADTAGNFLTPGATADKAIDVSIDNERKAAEHAEMVEIAHATGGVASFNNELASTLRRAMEQAQNYYTISYTPEAADWDGKYHRLEVMVDQPGAQLTYRRGYYARDVLPVTSRTKDDFLAALAPEAPAATSVLFTAQVAKNGDSAEIDYTIDPSSIHLVAGADGRRSADLDCAVLEFDDTGKVLEKSLVRLTEKLAAAPPGAPGLAGATAFRARQAIRLRAHAAVLVLGVRDRATGLFGTLEVEVAAVR